MRKLILYMTLTLDGVAAGENGPIDLVDYGDEGSWSDIFATIARVDGMMIGARTHREYLGYWHAAATDPQAKANERRFAEIALRTPHYVISRTLRSVEWPNVSVLAGVDAIAGLKRAAGRDLLLWGGPTVAAAAIEADLIDEYHFAMHPVIAGRGRKLFAHVSTPRRLRHLSTKAMPSGVVVQKHGRA